MKKIIIIGGSPAGIRFAQDYRGFDPESEIKVLLGNHDLPVVRQYLAAYLAGDMALEKVFFRSKDFYAQNKIELIFDRKISRLNCRRSQVTFDDKSKLDYDVLVLTDTLQTKIPEAKGNYRHGVFGLRSQVEIREIMNLLPVTETIVIGSSTLWGVRLAAAFRRKDKDVILVTPETRMLPGFVDAQSGELIKKILSDSGVRVVEQNEIVEVLGDTDVKAVRLKSGKVIATQIVLWPDAGPDMKLFRDTELAADERIPVSAGFHTNVSNVFALDEISGGPIFEVKSCQDSYLAVLEEQGRELASAMSGQGMIEGYPMNNFSVSFANDTIRLLGDPIEKTQTRVAVEQDLATRKYKKIFVEKETVTGAVLINCDSESNRMETLISERKNISEVPDRNWDDLQYVDNSAVGASGSASVNDGVLTTVAAMASAGTPSVD